MGYNGRLEIKKKAISLRNSGYSYQYIMDELKLPKSTVSDWCKNVLLTKGQLRSLYAGRKAGGLKGAIIAAKNKQIKRLAETKKLYEQGIKSVGKLSKRDRFVIGIALYAAEGTKIDNGCCFSNSDYTLIKFMVNWFREFGKVPENKFHGALWIHEGLNEMEAKKYWSSITQIPISQFYKSYIAVDKKNSRKIRKKLHEYGVFSFYVSDVILIRKIMGWIAGIIQKPWYNNEAHLHSPVAQR